MSLFSIGSEKRAIGFDHIAITINDISYTGITFLVRLLTYEELLKVNSVNADDPSIQLLLEEDIFNLVVDQVIGLDEKIDIDSVEAGVVSTVAGGVMSLSNTFFFDPQAGLATAAKGLTLFDQMQLVVAKNYNIQYKDVLSMPIDELARKFALFQTTFPNEALEFTNDTNS